MKSFIPPKLNKPLLKLVDFLGDFLLKAMHNIHEVQINEEDKEMLKTLKNERLLFFTNHPSTAEPPIVYLMANIIGDRFKYMGSRQVFQWGGGLVGWFIQNIGGFSVIAGAVDRQAVKMARSIIAEPAGKLVIFPEGEPTSGENDELMPFQQGVVQLTYWGLEDAKKTDPKADVTILSGFIKYLIISPDEEIKKSLNKSLLRIEKKLKIDHGQKNLMRRFLTIGRVILEKEEKHYGIVPKPEQEFDYRIGRVRHVILNAAAEKLKIQNIDPDADAITKWRLIFPYIEMMEVGMPDPKLPKITKEELHWVKNECIKAFDIIIIKTKTLLENPTAERMYEWLDRIEAYLDGKKPRMLGGVPSHLPRKAVVYLSKPFKLSEYFSEDKSEKKKLIQQFSDRIKNDMSVHLKKAMSLTTPLVKPFDVDSPDI